MPPKFSRELKCAISFDAQAPEDQPRTSPCEASCPAGHAIQRTIYLIQNERFEEALENVRAQHPFPGICGRSCYHPCESPCNRQYYDQGISVRALERAAFDLADRHKVRKPKKREKTGKKAAIIGSGPAGMTCAYFLALLGHGVTVFEALPELGGMPLGGIPDYRLPTEVVDEEVGEVLALGVKAKTNTRVGEDIPFREIKEQYDACLIATGAWKERRLGIQGSDLAISALTFLKQVKRGERPELRERVVIAGGGGVAFDVAGTVKRLGAPEVHVACLETKDGMVAPAEDIAQGEEEGVTIHNSKTFTRILSEDGRVSGIECMEVRSFSLDKAGELQVDPVPGTEHVLPADTIILAIGEEPDFGFLDGLEGFRFTEQGTLRVDAETLSTPVEGVFAAGDAITGPASVAEAIGKGRHAAISMDCYLTGRTMSDIQSIHINPHGEIVIMAYGPGAKKGRSQHVVGYEEIMNPVYYAKQNRVAMGRLPLVESIGGFKEINKGYTREEAIEEANRCFHCGHCSECGTCVDICPLDVLAMGSEGPEVVYPSECWHCGSCRINCPCGAVGYEFPLSMLI